MFYHWPISQCESRDLSRLVSRSVLAWLVDQSDGWRKKVLEDAFSVKINLYNTVQFEFGQQKIK